MNQEIVVLGNGLLGSSITNKTKWLNINRQKDGFDLTNKSTWNILEKINIKSIINCIGFAKKKSEKKENHWNVNYKGVVDLANFCYDKNIKLTHISSDIVYYNSESNAKEEDIPIHTNNWYSYTKLLSDGYIQLFNNYLLIRCSHKSKPFEFEKAYINYIGNFDYIDIISDLIIKLIKNNATGIYNVGTDVKTMYDLAKITNKNVECHVGKISNSKHIDLTMNLDKLKNFLRYINEQ